MSKNVIFDDFRPPPILQRIEYAENFTKQTCVANIDEQLWFHEGFVNVKFEGQKFEKPRKNVISAILQSMTRARRKLDTCTNTSKLQVDIFWELGIIIYHL